VAAAGWAWRIGAGGVLISVGLFLAYVWSDFPMNYAGFGMLPYLLAIPLGLLAAGAFQRYATTARLAWWLASALLMIVVVLAHFTSAMIVAPAAAVMYGAAVVEPYLPRREPRPTRRWLFHAGVVAIPLLVLLANAFWWLPGMWLTSTKGPSDFAFVHPEGVVARLVKIVDAEPHIERWLWLLGLAGLVVAWCRDRIAAAGLTAFIAAGFAWGYLAGSSRSLDFLQPGRHTLAFYTGLTLSAGSGIAWLLVYMRGLSPMRLDRVSAIVLAGGLAWDVGPGLYHGLTGRVLAPYPFLGSRPSPYLLWVERGLRKNVRPGERVLYEEGGKDVPGEPDPFQLGRFSGLLADRLGIEMIGGPYLHASLTTNFTQFGEGKLCTHGDWDRTTFLRYARLYRPAAIVCWTRRARRFCEENPDLVEVRERSPMVLIGRIKGFEGAAISGRAEVEAIPGRLRVTRAEVGLDGTVVLRYHSVPCLRSDPPVAWEPVFLEDDPVPFIKLRPTAGPVTFALRIPPGSRGAAVPGMTAQAGR
jgi:hypothetical protein